MDWQTHASISQRTAHIDLQPPDVGPYVEGDEEMVQHRKISRGRYVFHAGDRFDGVYAIRTGSFLTEVGTESGQEQVTCFYFAGEVFGFDGMQDNLHRCSVRALEDSEIYMIPSGRVRDPMSQSPGLQRQLLKYMSEEIIRSHRLMVMLGSMRSEARLATFLLDLSRRMHARGYSPTEFVLRMSRGELASHLGLTVETVGRNFNRLQDCGLVEVARKHVRLLDMDRLSALVEAGSVSLA
ncbi:MAG: helix-turn-helix domain-containing protein [Rhodocyclaceae bacterium]